MLQEAIQLIQSSCTERGITASSIAQENYKRIWARDSMIAGISGLLSKDPIIIKGFRDSLITLKNNQNDLGIIPSNVKDNLVKSYGGVAGRVDATLWYIVGACLYMLNHKESEKPELWKSSLDKALLTLNYWEFNNKHLVYTPISGNWADEYPVKGHTLYDNMLRLWGLWLCSIIYREEETINKFSEVREKILINFWPKRDYLEGRYVYHRTAYEEAINDKRQFWCSNIGPYGFTDHFDCAGTALMLLSGLPTMEQVSLLVKFLKELFFDFKESMVPAFWPPIFPDSDQWQELQSNYSFSFKNHPYQFHNGAVWPVWMGLLCLGLSKYGQSDLVSEIHLAYDKHLVKNNHSFNEYIRTDTFEAAGKENLVYSASGAIFMDKAKESRAFQKLNFEI